MTEQLVRVFISVSVPKEIVDIKEMLKSTVNAKGTKIRWVRNGSMHLTLKFIGNTTEKSIDTINKTIHDAVKGMPVIDLSISGTGCFSKGKKVNALWVGVKGEIEELKKE